jgi:hypothetical protein
MRSTRLATSSRTSLRPVPTVQADFPFVDAGEMRVGILRESVETDVRRVDLGIHGQELRTSAEQLDSLGRDQSVPMIGTRSPRRIGVRQSRLQGRAESVLRLAFQREVVHLCRLRAVW